MLAAIARIALFGTFDNAELPDVLASFSVPRLRSQLASLGICNYDAEDQEVARLYFSGRCRSISPNAFFDETWYSQHYPEVVVALKKGGLISGFIHFLKYGIREGLWPNQVLHADSLAWPMPALPLQAIDAVAYTSRYPAAAAFMSAFPSINALDHYNLYGRFLGYSLVSPIAPTGEALSLRAVQAEFDPDFYTARYLASADGAAFRLVPFDHYAQVGMRQGFSPNDWFDESFYRAFYKDVREAVRDGWLPSAFYHYVLSGRVEGRLPRHDLTATLEIRMPGVTQPALLPLTDMLRARLAGPKSLPTLSRSQDQAPSIWVFMPTLNPDIMYGGYRAAIQLICALVAAGSRVCIVCVSEDANPAYFLWSERSPSVRKVFQSLEILNLDEFCEGQVGARDLFVAYTVWDLALCSRLATLTLNRLPLLLAQEYEPIFYDNGAQRALCHACYNVPHYPIINSTFLQSYFMQNEIGIYQRGRPSQESRDYIVFEHKINVAIPQTPAMMRARTHRVMAIYARPESHAARNLFEVIVIALQTLCEQGVFGPEWSFIGLGALSKIPPIPLGGGHELKLRQKMSEEDYRIVMSEMDIGISLMYAPHPSVVPFEFATTGAIVITNTYLNRSAAELRAICNNIVPCESSVPSLVAAIRSAIVLVDNVELRAAQASRPPDRDWGAIFSPAFIAGLLSAVQQPAEQPRPGTIAVKPLTHAKQSPVRPNGRGAVARNRTALASVAEL